MEKKKEFSIRINTQWDKRRATCAIHIVADMVLFDYNDGMNHYRQKHTKWDEK